MPHFEYADSEPVSPKKFLGKVDEHLDRYLTEEVEQPDGVEHGSDVDANLLRVILGTRKPFSQVLCSSIADVDWGSEDLLSAEEFQKLCTKVSEFTDGYCKDHSERLWREALEKQMSVMALAGKEIFEDEGIKQHHMNMFFRFGGWLRRIYLHESKTKEELKADEHVDAFMALNDAYNIVVGSIATEAQESMLGKQLLHSFLKLANSDVQSRDIQMWMGELEAELQQLSENASSENIQQVVEKVFRKHFPNFWIENVTREVAKVVKIGTNDECRIKVLPVEHFYFQETIGESTETDHLPPEGNLHHGEHVFHNATLFNNLGEKVFWGDLTNDEIKEIRGPYYVLSQGDSYFDVPAWAMLPESTVPAGDINRPKGLPDAMFASDKRLLRLSYIKAVAMGVIENGQFTKNPTEIRWSED